MQLSFSFPSSRQEPHLFIRYFGIGIVRISIPNVEYQTRILWCNLSDGIRQSLPTLNSIKI